MTTDTPRRRGLPYRWRPDNAHEVNDPPPVGAFVAWQHQALQVTEVRLVPEDLWSDDDRSTAATPGWTTPYVVVAHPVRPPADQPVHLRAGGARTNYWWVYRDGHFPVCAACGDPTPCRDRSAAVYAARRAGRVAAYEMPGVCPACQEVVTSRQERIRFPGNLVIPGGPTLTFHLRRGCLPAAADYEQRWVAADPGNRRTTLSCPGAVTTHADGTYSCTAGGDCRGPAARHVHRSLCEAPACAGLPFDLYPAVDAARVPGCG